MKQISDHRRGAKCHHGLFGHSVNHNHTDRYMAMILLSKGKETADEIDAQQEWRVANHLTGSASVSSDCTRRSKKVRGSIQWRAKRSAVCQWCAVKLSETMM